MPLLVADDIYPSSLGDLLCPGMYQVHTIYPSVDIHALVGSSWDVGGK